ncbi:hypothetical protein PMAYCL1PPCAC_16478 [Pristionchus mayeri]|uniref:G protein-coupled receptor n=1 Tax=Pristionchus mayeri TaxID=1317129 RepID=A0AAN5CKZ2_9BILA|nr:hypothetical protein PMAYCL1PPCAC_16478 [Pristionchus mayeri]
MVLDDSWRAYTVQYGHGGVRPVHIIAFSLAIANFILNGLIWYAFIVSSNFINKSRLQIFYALAVTNCLTGFFSLPTFVNLFVHDNINCPKWSIIVGSAFEMALDRMRAVLAIAIAVERLVAICRPHAFFNSDHRKNARRVCAFGAIWSIADALFMICEDGLSPVSGSLAAHCVSTSSSGPLFHSYFLILSLIDGFILLVVYLVFLVKFLNIRMSALQSPTEVCVLFSRAQNSRGSFSTVHNL